MKFTKQEKVAGVFVLAALSVSFFSFIGVAVKKGWFSPKVSYHTYLPSAEGVAPGTGVQMSGLNVGKVTEIKLISQNKVNVKFDVYSEYSSKIGEGAQVMVFRPFLIGDKVLDIQVEEESGTPLAAGELIPSVTTADLMDVLSGKKMGMVLGSFESLAQSLKVIGDAFADGQRAKNLVKLMDQMGPLVKNMKKITDVALKQKRLEEVMTNLALVSRELGTMIPVFKEQTPDFAVSLAKIVENMEVLTTEFKKITPAISAVAPELPRTSLRAVEALDEAVVVLKAMQKSFFLRGSAQEVREEEGARQPAQKK